MKYCFVFLFLFTALFWACTHDKGTGPDGGGNTGYDLEGCWESFLIEEYTDSGWVDVTNGRIDTLLFKSDTTWIGHSYSFNPFDSSFSMREDFGDIKLGQDTVYIQSQSNLAEFIPHHFSIEGDTLKMDEFSEVVTSRRDFWIKKSCAF